jgi:hypothetical protein
MCGGGQGTIEPHGMADTVKSTCAKSVMELVTVTLEGGIVGKVQHNTKFGTGTRNYHTHRDILPRKGTEHRDSPSYRSNKWSKHVS